MNIVLEGRTDILVLRLYGCKDSADMAWRAIFER